MTRVRQVIHRGQVAAWGLYLDTRRIPESLLKQRLLAWWCLGARVHRLPPGYVLLLPEPRLTDSRFAPGTPLMIQNDFYTSAPLSESEIHTLQPATGSVVIVDGGLATAHACTSENSIDPSSWLDLDAYPRVSVSPLGQPPPAPELVQPSNKPIRKLLGNTIPPAAGEMQDLLQALSQMQDSKVEKQAGMGRFFLSALAQRFKRSLNSKSQVSTSADQAGSTPNWLSQILLTGRLGRYLGWRQANYLRRMLDMFEDGDINNALRHALPLNNSSNPGANRPALGLPKVRGNLDISPQLLGGGTSIGLHEELFQHLRQIYRRCFERLDRARQITEAAFVLAELLQESEEAVSYLERHGQLRQAAELAESRNLAPGLVVRQWFLAGDKERAVAAARRSGAFADAVLRLERNHKKRALVLRLLWARSLSETGDYEAAVNALWPVERARRLPLVASWMKHILDGGGHAAARMLARSLIMWPQRFTQTCERIQSLLEDENINETMTRRVFAETLLEQAQTPEVIALARPAYRNLLRDYHRNQDIPRKLLSRLLKLAKDGALRTDAPIPQRRDASSQIPLNRRTQPLELTFDELGTMAVTDIHALANNRYLLALGEAGVRWLGERGQTLAHFETPAHHLVVSEHGNRVIALAKRGGFWRLSRIQLDSRRSTFWTEAQLQAFTSDYDGSLWYIANHNMVAAIDAQAADFKALWRVAELPGSVLVMTRSKQSLAFTLAAEQLQIWRYQLPDPTLRYRDQLRLPWQPGQAIALSADTTVASYSVFEEQRSLILEHPQSSQVTSWNLDIIGALQTPILGAQWAALPARDSNGVSLHLFDLEQVKQRAQLNFPRAQQLSARFTDNTLLMADDWGRVVKLDLQWGALLSNIHA